MKALFPAIVLLILYFCFVSSVGISANQLPDPVASHFNFKGDADGWMSRKEYLLFMIVLGSGLILLLIVVSFVCRFIPDKLINLPRREYWLAPQRRMETKAYCTTQILWFACWLDIFLIGMNFSVIDANKRVPAHLPNWEIYGLLAVFLGGMVVLSYNFWSHFKRID